MKVNEQVLRFLHDPNAAVFTTRQINAGDPIMHVSHDADGDWQFLPIYSPDPKDGVLVHLRHLLERDATLAELWDLPLGWHAWRHERKNPWTREAWSDDHIAEFSNN